jgi:hypothetical protein
MESAALNNKRRRQAREDYQKLTELESRLEELALRTKEHAPLHNHDDGQGSLQQQQLRAGGNPTMPLRDYTDEEGDDGLADRLLSVRRLQPEHQNRLLPAVLEAVGKQGRSRPPMAREGSELMSLEALEERLQLLNNAGLQHGNNAADEVTT